MLVNTLLWGVVAPAIVALAVAVLLGRMRVLAPHVAAAVAVCGGYAVGHLGIAGFSGWLPQGATHWMPHVSVIMAASLGSVALAGGGRGRAMGAVVASSLLTAWLLLRPLGERMDGGSYAAMIVGGGVAIAAYALAWWHVASASHQSRGGGIALVLVAASLAATAAATGSLLVGQLGGVVAAAAAAVQVADLTTKTRLGLGAMAASAGVILGGLAVVAVAYSSTPPGSIALLGAVPVALWGAGHLLGGRLRPVGAAAVLGLVGAVLSASAVTWSLVPGGSSQAAQDASGSEYDYGYGYD